MPDFTPQYMGLPLFGYCLMGVFGAASLWKMKYGFTHDKELVFS